MNKKSKKGWKTFDFDDENPKETTKRTLNKSTPLKEPPKPIKEHKFEALITPKLIEDLAVHSKKINEVRSWLERNVLRVKSKRNGSILLITGPTGCGKTITLNVLCKIMNIDVSEWINPIDKDYEDFKGPGQTSQLIHFLSESKYPSLLTLNTTKLVLIEDFPNSVINNPDDFSKILQKAYNTEIAVVFICTDETSSNINLSQKLFPQDLRNLYQITEISFNSCSSTQLKQCLKRVQTIIESSTDLNPPPKTQNEVLMSNIILSSMGDIRCAINQYYFACLKSSNVSLNSPILKPNAKRKRSQKNSTLKNPKHIKEMMKDETLNFFHSLGRVLNSKRVESGSSWRLKADINNLIDALSIQPSTFNAFLYENYLKYFGDLNDVSKAADSLSAAQIVLGKWTENQENLIYGLWISVLGVMVNNEHRVSMWTPINAPKKFTKTLKCQVDEINVEDRFYVNRITKGDRYKSHLLKQ